MASTQDSSQNSPEELLPSFKEELGSLADGVSDSNLLKFLHWKCDVKRAAGRFRDHLTWRQDNPWAMDDPDKPLQASKDSDLQRVLESEFVVAPEGLVDKKGHTVLIGRFRNNNMSDGRTSQDIVRTMIYTIDRLLERESTQQHGITVFHDLNGLSRNNISPAAAKILLRALIGHFPIRIKNIYILNAPLFFRGFFSVLSLAMPSKMRARTHFVHSMDDIYKVIDQRELLEEHGGQRVHDSTAWVAQQMEREANDSIDSLQACVVLKPGSI